MNELLLHPVLPFLVGAVLISRVPRRVGHVVMIAAPLVALGQIAALDTGTSVGLSYLHYDLEVLRVDALSTPFGVIFAIAGVIAGVYGLTVQRRMERTAALAYAGGAIGVVFAGDLLTFFVFWEIKAVASTFVILARGTPVSGRAGMRYLFVHILGGKLLLAGVLLHHSQTGSLQFTGFDVTAASSLILAACLLSAAVPPLHAWLADAYPTASVAGTVFLSAYTTKAAVYALARGFAGFEVLIYLGIAMALFGVTYAMFENDIRRLLSYHIVSQVGYMVAAVGVGTELAVNGATAHAFAHILYKALLLMGAGAVLHATGISRANALGGLARRMRGVFVLYMVGAVSIAGFPLFSGFISKELSVEAAYGEQLLWLVILMKVVAVGTFLSTGLKLPHSTWFGPEGAGPSSNTGARVHVGAVPVTMFVAMGISAGLNLLLGLAPGLLYDLLPYPVDYTPYSLAKVLETSQVLLFTGLGFWILHERLGTKPKVSLDTDWTYRRLPHVVANATAQWQAAGATPAVMGAALVRIRHAVARRFAVVHGPTPVTSMWALGSVVLATSVLLLLMSLSS